MWFRPEDIHTDALDKIIASSRDRTEVDMVEVLMDIMEVKNLDEVSFCVNDLAGLMKFYNDNSEIRKIRRLLKDSWKLQPASNAYCYRTFAINFNRVENPNEIDPRIPVEIDPLFFFQLAPSRTDLPRNKTTVFSHFEMFMIQGAE